jgi:hypothetical protein
MNDYALWYAEINPSDTGFEITRKIAALLAVRLTWGSAIIVCDMPHSLRPTLEKRWKAILQLIEAEYKDTKGTVAKAEMKQYLKLLARVRFRDEVPDQPVPIDPVVWLVNLDDCQQIPQSVASIYIVNDVSMAQLQFWIRQANDVSQIVLFRREPLGYVSNTQQKEKVLR